MRSLGPAGRGRPPLPVTALHQQLAPYAVEARGVTKRYGSVVALDAARVEIRSGRITALIGPNGAGKTTLLRIIAGALLPDAGEIKLFDQPTDPGGRLLRRSSAFVAGVSGVYPSLSCDENLRVSCILQGAQPGRIGEALDYVGLAALRHRKAATLSTGLRQRLALAAAFLPDVPLLLLDEPTNGLDPDGVDDVHQILRRYREDRGATIIISSHQLEHLSNICDDVILVRDGRIVAHKDGRVAASVYLRSPSAGSIETALRGLHVPHVKQGRYWKLSVTRGEDTDAFAARVVRALHDRGVDICEVSMRESALAQLYHGDLRS